MATKIYVVEHLDPELGPWSALEYKTILEESRQQNARFMLTSVPRNLEIPSILKDAGLHIEHSASEELFAESKETVCLLDPAGAEELSPSDGDKFNIFLFGGILGDDPPRDRTSELRKKGFQGRRLGPKQMTTDTAARVVRMVVQDRVSLDQIPYVDSPWIKVDEYESTQMHFRYVKGQDGEPIMPKGMEELIKNDSEKGVADLL